MDKIKYIKNASRDDKENLFIILLVATLFCGNQLIKNKINIPYLGYFLKNHHNDFLGGVSFMSVINVILSFSKYNKINNLTTILFIGLMCSVFWEVVTPIYLTRSTGDFYDAIAYCAGFLVYWLVKNIKDCK